MKIQAESVHFPIDTQLMSLIQQKVFRLKSFFHRINEARVIFTYEQSGQKQEIVAEVKIHLPNGIIFIKERSKTFEAALGKALVGLKVLLLRHKAKRLSYCHT